MSRVFRRRKKASAEADELAEGTDAADLDEDAADEDGDPDTPPEPVVPERPQGPWDVDDVPEDGVQRIDLGGLRVPVPPATEVRVDVNAEGEVVAATLVQGPSAMQVNAFAAPKRSGIWEEVRAEITETLVGGGGQASDVPGPYGPELFAAVPVQGGGATPARFIGVDGPRWFLRAMLTGPAAQDRSVAGPLESALRDVVVVRGSEAMAVRDALPLRLPREVAEQAAASAEQEADPAPDLTMPERGPEITEVR
ncbi:MAG: FIG01122115: hypothetical protein [uncultured Frankineae bacterium]|uniref:DUF3710 domain-containing protein n=1 Tax=uncultured Frankineae bacterium TaxID=437475 RepID=A0A6J4MLH3_9ACTN|nr:MAG: FIG01122115: hypothetical protein [uncultured Frankineae bacterium]